MPNLIRTTLALTPVNKVNDHRREESSKVLADEVSRHLPPGELLGDGQGQGDGRVEVAAADAARDVDAHHDADAEAPVDAEDGAVAAFAQYGLGHAAIAEDLGPMS